MIADRTERKARRFDVNLQSDVKTIHEKTEHAQRLTVHPGSGWSREATLGRLAACCLSALLALGGCARSLKSIDAGRDAFATGDLITARATLADHASSRNRFSDAAALDLAMVELASGDAAAAESRLRVLRDQFDALPKLAPLHETASMVSDDTARVFRPAGYEQVMIRALLSVCSLATDQVDAESYALQSMMKQNELAREAEQRGVLDAAEIYQPIALAPYLRGMLREATHHDYDDAAKAYQLVSSVRPQFAPVQADIQRASVGTHSAPGHGVLYVIACVGRGPVLRETTAPTTSTALSIASSVLNAETNEEPTEHGQRVGGPVLPNIAAVKIPEVVLPPSDVAAIGVRVDETLYGATQTLTDVGELASQQVAAERPWTIARAVVRRATKETAVAKVGDALGLSGTTGSLFHFAAASAWSGVEHADTRCWGLLPREIQVFRAELPSGAHQVSLQPLGYSGAALAAGRTERVQIVDGRNQYLIVVSPGPRLYVVNNPLNQPARRARQAARVSISGSREVDAL